MNIEELESVVDAMADEGGDQIDALYDTITLQKDTYNGFICRLREVVRLAKNEQEKSAPVGNAAEMREAYEFAEEFLRDYGTDWKLHNKLCDMLKSALAAPLRNCDVGTPDEQAERFENFCLKHIGCAEETGGRHCVGCPLEKASRNITQKCELYWAQMPYNESEVEK